MSVASVASYGCCWQDMCFLVFYKLMDLLLKAVCVQWKLYFNIWVVIFSWGTDTWVHRFPCEQQWTTLPVIHTVTRRNIRPPSCVAESGYSVEWCSKYISNLGYFPLLNWILVLLNIKCASFLSIVKSQLGIFVEYSLVIRRTWVCPFSFFLHAYSFL